MGELSAARRGGLEPLPAPSAAREFGKTPPPLLVPMEGGDLCWGCLPWGGPRAIQTPAALLREAIGTNWVPFAMLQLTKRTEYGLIALTHLAVREGEVTSAREISERFPVPPRLLAQVLKSLSRANLVESRRGAQGGYSLARSADEITVGDVVEALEGPPTLTSCESTVEDPSGPCGVESVCPIRNPITNLRTGIWDLLQRTTLRDLLRQTISGHLAAS